MEPGTDYQLICGVYAMFVYFALVCFFQPYRSPADNYVWIASLAHLFIVVYLGQLFSLKRGDPNALSGTFVSVVLAVACARAKHAGP